MKRTIWILVATLVVLATGALADATFETPTPQTTPDTSVGSDLLAESTDGGGKKGEGG